MWSKDEVKLSFSPNGQYMAVTLPDRVGIIKVKDGTFVTVGDDQKKVRGYSWSGDNAVVLYIQEKDSAMGQFVRYTLGTDLSQGSSIMSAKMQCSQGGPSPFWSPFGRFAVVSSGAHKEESEVSILDLERGDVAASLKGNYLASAPSWRNDEKKVVLFCDDGEVFAVDLGSGKAQCITNLCEIASPGYKGFSGEPTWTSDDKYIVIHAWGDQEDLMVVEPFQIKKFSKEWFEARVLPVPGLIEVRNKEYMHYVVDYDGKVVFRLEGKLSRNGAWCAKVDESGLSVWPMSMPAS